MMTIFHMASPCEAGGLRGDALRLCAFALRLFLCRFRHRLPTLCRFSAIPFTAKTHVSTAINHISTTKHPHIIELSPSSTQNSLLFTRHCKKDCRLAENKTRQIGNLNTVNKTQTPQKNKHHKNPDNDTFTAYNLITIPYKHPFSERFLTMNKKWRVLLLLALAELLAMAVWFSASAVVPALTEAWQLDADGQSWLTMSVQIGFVVGAFGSAILTTADRFPAKWLFTVSAFAAALCTLLIPLLATGLFAALILRFLTGVFLAGVYPVGMKIMATWTKADRGLGIGLLVGALTVGSAAPHLLNVFGGTEDWQPVLFLAAGLAATGAMIGALFIEEGEYRTKAPRFEWRHIGSILRDRDVMLANAGYLGHMWELYAMWAWIPAFLLASFRTSGTDEQLARLLAFAVIAIGGAGSLLAGKLADRYGRTTITTISLVTSGSCALLIGFFFGGSPVLLAILTLIWGFAIVADSAQFSACVSELADSQLVGTALTLQTSMGFLLTLISIRLVPALEAAIGWQWAFVFLAIGPIAGIIAMQTLRRSAAALKLAGGRR